MAGQLIPPPELAPPSLAGLTPAQRVEVWRDMMDTGEQMLVAGIRLRLGPSADVRQEYRNWYSQKMDEHDRTLYHMLEELDHRTHGLRSPRRSGGSQVEDAPAERARRVR